MLKRGLLNKLPYTFNGYFVVNDHSGAPARAKRTWGRAPYSWETVNLFSFGCHVIDRAYVRTRLRIVRVGFSVSRAQVSTHRSQVFF